MGKSLAERSLSVLRMSFKFWLSFLPLSFSIFKGIWEGLAARVRRSSPFCLHSQTVYHPVLLMAVLQHSLWKSTWLLESQTWVQVLPLPIYHQCESGQLASAVSRPALLPEALFSWLLDLILLSHQSLIPHSLFCRSAH